MRKIQLAPSRERQRPVFHIVIRFHAQTERSKQLKIEN